MKATPVEIEKYLRLLEETPRSIADLTAGSDDRALEFKPAERSWSVRDVLAHLRSCADLWSFSIYAMLAEDEPVLPDIDERKWTKAAGYGDVPFRESFQIFTLERKDLLRVLRALPFEAWEKPAMIFERKHTVFTQVRRMAKHEEEHCEQIERLLRDVLRR